MDRRSDVYGLGCCLYFAVSGKPPFPGGTNVDKIHCHRTQEPVPLLHLNPSLPPPFVQIVRQMMAKDPARRYPTAKAVEEDLRAWAAGDSRAAAGRPGGRRLPGSRGRAAGGRAADRRDLHEPRHRGLEAGHGRGRAAAGAGGAVVEAVETAARVGDGLAAGVAALLLLEFILAIVAFVLLRRK